MSRFNLARLWLSCSSSYLTRHTYTNMFGLVSRRNVVVQANRQWLKAAVYHQQQQQRSYASGLRSALKISSIPAPHAGIITVLSLDRPKARNAISTQLLSELSGVVEGLHEEGGKGSTRALILASESDNAFCAGADLKERLGMSPEE
jgi:methylglutaconyl-CoA hydratase